MEGHKLEECDISTASTLLLLGTTAATLSL